LRFELIEMGHRGGGWVFGAVEPIAGGWNGPAMGGASDATSIMSMA
jgi:hypothetical protein